MNETPKTETELSNALLRNEMAALKAELDELRTDIKGLVEAWRTANGVVAFVKWLAGISTAVGVVWAAFKFKIGA
jgi:hypothetical protein